MVHLNLLEVLLQVLDRSPETKGDSSSQCQAEGQEEGHDGPRRLCLVLRHLLGSKAHAEAGQVSIGKGEEDHEDDVPGIVAEPHGLGNHTRLDITEHEEGDEDDPQAHEDRKPNAVLARPHTDGRQTPASPVHHVEKEET